MAHHLNTNKQFMVGNGILAFAVIFVVVNVFLLLPGSGIRFCLRVTQHQII